MDNMPDFENESRVKLRWYIENFPSPHPFFKPAMAALEKKEAEDDLRRANQSTIYIQDSNVANLNLGTQIGPSAAQAIGQDSASSADSAADAVSQLKRDHKLRDDLHRDLLKSPAERMRSPVPSSRMTKFAHGEVIIHRIGDTTYPNVDESPGISGWFKLETFDFYHRGLECILDLQYALLGETRAWALLSCDQSEQTFPNELRIVKVFITGRIPFRNIRYYDMRGDEFYPQPHLYCQYADNGEPYESRGYYIIDERGGYEFSLDPEWKRTPEEMVSGLHENGSMR